MDVRSSVLFRLPATLRTRAAFGLRPATTPVMVFVPLGLLLGPWGAGVITLRALAYLDVVVSIALATLGVFVGIAAGTQQGALRRFVTASAAQATVTMLTVAAAIYILLNIWGLPLGTSAGLAAISLGIAAAASAAPFVEDADERARRIAARIADLDDMLPIVAGAVVLPMLTEDHRNPAADIAITLAAGVGAGLSGWLLFDEARGAERGVFVVGTLALLGGAAAYIGASPLLAGMAAGFIWARTPGHTDRIAAKDLRKVEHPLVVLLLLIAGASLQPTPAGIWLLAPYVMFRTTGKLIGGWVASRVAPGVAPGDLGAYLMPPGVFGIAFTLNLYQVHPEAAGPLVFAAAIGAIVSEFLALIVTPSPEPA